MSQWAVTLKASLSVHAGATPTKERVTFTFVNVHAILHHHEAALVALKALAFKAAWRVDTDAAAAEVGGDPALINVSTVSFLHVQGEAIIATALEASNCVSALPIGAHPRKGFALVDIFVKWTPSEDVPSVSKAWAPRAQGLIFLGARLRTFFTLCAPSCPDCTAAGVHAELPRDRVDALILIPLQEAVLHTDIQTHPAGTIQSKTFRAFTVERAFAVDTASIWTDARKHLAFINVFASHTFDPGKPSWASCI